MIEIFLIGLICHIGDGGSVTRAALIADLDHHAIIATKRKQMEFALPTFLHPQTHVVTFGDPSDATFKDGPATTDTNFDLVPHLRLTTNGTIRSTVESGADDWAVIAYVEFPRGQLQTAEVYQNKAIYIVDGEQRYEGCVAKRTRFYSSVSRSIDVYVDGVLFDQVPPGERVEISNVRKGATMPARGDFARQSRLLDTTTSAFILTEDRQCQGSFYCDNGSCRELIQVADGMEKHAGDAKKFHPTNDTSVECSNSHWP